MVLGAMNPGRMPWPGMNDTFGVSEASPELHRACLEEIRPAPNVNSQGWISLNLLYQVVIHHQQRPSTTYTSVVITAICKLAEADGNRTHLELC